MSFPHAKPVPPSLISSSASSAALAGRVEAPEPPPSYTRHVFSNGLTLLVQENHAHPLVAFHAVVRAGSATEGRFLGMGVSHVVEHMLFKGTQRRAVGAVEREARSYGGTSQGFTTYDTTSYQLVVNREHWSDAADLLLDALYHSTFDPAEFTKEREVVLRELKLRQDDPVQVAWDLLFENAYRVHPYRIPIIGYEPLLRKMTDEDVRGYYRRRYLPNTTVIAVAGDVQTDEVIRRIGDLTKELEPGRVPETALPEEPLPISPREAIQEGDLQLGILAVGLPSVSGNNPDLFALDLLARLLGGERGSRLEKALKETGLVYAVHCENYTPAHPGLFTVTMRLDADHLRDAEERVWKEFARAAQELFSQEELEEAKRALLRGYLDGRQTVGGLAADLAGYEVLVGDPAFAARYLAGVRAVTPEGLERVARRYLVRDHSTTVGLFPRGSLPEGKGTAPAAAAEPSAEKVTLDNGLRVILRPDPRLGLATLQLSMLGGVRYETEQTNGVCHLVSQMLLRGTRHKSADQINDLVKEMGGSLSPFSGRNSLGLTLEALSSELPKAIPLLVELAAEPDFPAGGLEKERGLALAALKAKEEDPFSWGMRRLLPLLFTRHPYRLDPDGDEKVLQGLKREDLVRFYGRVLEPKRMVISVAGRFGRKEALDLLRQTAGKIPSSEQPAQEVPSEPPMAASRERMESSPREEALVLIGFPGLRVTDPRAPALDVIEAILSGGAGRLFTEVRERRGLAYTVGAFALDGMDPGAFILYAATDPSQADAVRSAMLEEVRRLRQIDVPEEELQEAKQGLLGNRRIARQTQQTLASQLAGDELFGLGYDYSGRYDAQVQKVDAAEVRRVAGELLDTQRCAVLIGRR